MNSRSLPFRRAGLPLASLFAGAALLAACSSSPSSSNTTTTTVAPQTTSSLATTTTAAAAACSTGVLELSVSTGGTAAGSSYDVFEVTNTGPKACTINGYPTLTLFGPSPGGGAGAGPKLPLTTQEGGPTASAVVVEPGKSAEFLLFFADVPVGGAGCSTVASVEVQPPGSDESLTAPASFSPCGPSVKVYPFGVPGSENP